MGGGIFAELNLSPTERLASQFIPSLLSQGLSANGVLSALRQQGLGVRRSVGLSLIRYAKGLSISSNYVKSVPNKYYVNPARLSYSKSPLMNDYHYIIKVTYTNTKTGAKIEQHVTVTTDYLITKAQAESQASDILVSGNYGAANVVTDTLTQNIVKNVAAAGRI